MTHPHLVWPVRMDSIRRLDRTATARCLLPWWAASTVQLEPLMSMALPHLAQIAVLDFIRLLVPHHVRCVQQALMITTDRPALHACCAAMVHMHRQDHWPAQLVPQAFMTTTTIQLHRVSQSRAHARQAITMTVATAQRALQAHTTTIQIHRRRAIHVAPERTRL